MVGALLLDNTLINDVLLTVGAEHFHSLQYRSMYEAICKLFIDGSPVAPETVASTLKNKNTIEGNALELVGGPSAIIKTIEDTNPGEFNFWVDVVKRKFDERKLVEFASQTMSLALSNPDDIKKTRNQIEESLISLGNEKSSSSISIENAIPEIQARIQRYIDDPDGIIGIESGLTRLDHDIDGFQHGNVSIVYAPTSRFKSLFVQNLGWRFAARGVPGLWFTTEMPRVQVLERILQIQTGLNFKWLRRDKRIFERKNAIKQGVEKLSSYPIYFCDTSSLDVSEIRAEVNRHKRWHDIEYIIVDLVDHVYSSRFKDEMVNNQRVVMSSMKQIAKDFNIHVMLVSHIAKGDQQMRRQADLDVEQMVGSGAKSQDVDVAISVAPVSYAEGTKMQAMQRDEILYRIASEGTIDVLVSITKSRHGELDRFILTLDFNKGGRFVENGWIEIREPIDKQE